MNRDSAEFVQLITAAQSAVLGYIVSLGFDHARAKDVLQETNLTLWKKADSYEEGTHFNSWACKIAYYHVLNHRRKAYREQLVFDDDLFDYLAERQEHRARESDSRESALRKCLEKLPQKHSELVEQRYRPGASV
ncbi:MAG: sigma-70 family RNA polymerase sigma factor, partial [Verrucomicrobiales bacterium]|nr:sigma-70 family RNA polymerase sigma factor [Verrucomicrobiales bacterium]